VTRVLSGVVLIGIVFSATWWGSNAVFWLLAETFLVLAFVEYARLSAACALPIPRVAAGVATVAASIGMTSTRWIGEAIMGNAVFLDAALLSALVVVSSISLVDRTGERPVLARASAAIFPALYLGMPFGAIISTRSLGGREALMLLLLAVAVSDTAQYYSGRLFGRRPLAPAISPKKTLEGAIGGFVCGALFVGVAGAWWLPGMPLAFRLLLGATIVALGIVGDLFESMIKRNAGLKDSSALIPGHGGMLDRIDALLFAAPVYYIVLKYA
jgi:phosphatidate cytidylyltransferase